MVIDRNSTKVNIKLQKQLENRLREIIKTKDLAEYKTSQKKIAFKLGIDPLDCAAAIHYLLQENCNKFYYEEKFNAAKEQASAIRIIRMLWYRLEVGRKHQVTVDMLKRVLVEESGVEMRLIGRVDIYDKHTLIQLPNGMPTELLHHLKTVTIGRQNLGIKRLKSGSNRRSKKFKNKQKKRPTDAGSLQGKTRVA